MQTQYSAMRMAEIEPRPLPTGLNVSVERF